MNGLDRKNGLSFVTIVTKENGEGSRIATPLHFLCKRLTFFHFLCCLLLVLGKELRALGVLLGGGVEGTITSLNPLAEESGAVTLHSLGTTDGIEVIEGEGVLQDDKQAF